MDGLLNESCFILLELEDNREGVCYLYRTVSLLSRSPLRGHRDYANSLFIQRRIHAAEHFDIAYGTVRVNGELESHTALYTVFLRDFRIYELLVNPLGEVVSIFTLEHRLILDELERNSFLFHHFLFHFLYVIHNLHAHISVVLEVHKEIIIYFYLIVNDVDLVREIRNLRDFRWRWRSLLSNRNHFLFLYYDRLRLQYGLGFLAGSIGECSPNYQKRYHEADFNKQQSFVLETSFTCFLNFHIFIIFNIL